MLPWLGRFMVSWCFSGLFICLGSGQPIRRPSIFDAFYFDFLYLGGNWGVRFWSLPFEKKDGPQDWERNAQKSDMKPGVHLARMSNQEYGKIEHGLCALILAGQGWIDRNSDKKKTLIRPPNEVAG